ncbi:hypothetical protein CANARDRAFT_7683 [[Candida] arabinofermentans NRRL YB-2248]|uniref:N-(5'-phosphoribosyl)anthranilate isomerase n=1 Tax=[Candida] arabinofermentans NRRL YB-2248 TaxID=983967 RepID=A0A1E4T1E2_9ASCO|nr:hypothetical protein CANARDRAFT_7683 [[Candida] arabinofermentans NRRL YB-2248]
MTRKVVKICGLQTTEAAQQAIASGADLLGVILVPNRARTIEHLTAKQLSALCKEQRQKHQREFISSKDLLAHLRSKMTEYSGSEWFEYAVDQISANGPFLVGVFRNQPLSEVQKLSDALDLDFIQLHGSENFPEYIEALDKPVIPRYVLQQTNISEALETGRHIIPLLDSEFGGEGKVISWSDASQFGNSNGLNGRYLLAGGLNPDNVKEALGVDGCIGVDVSGGTETEGVKDLNKIKLFVSNAKTMV